MLAFALITAVVAASLASANDAPVVDLGYAVHKASLNDPGNYYDFKNIRFAEPPVGEYRFKPSVPVSTVARTVNDGSVGYKCLQAYPEWSLKASAAAANVTVEQMHMLTASDPDMSEDCLFLNVAVPKAIFDVEASKNKAPGTPAGGTPVMVWIFGGGYDFGYKDDPTFDPSGLIARSQENGGEGIVYVALNYRLGMYGWLNGDDDEDIFPNAALQDQRLGLEWVKRHIHQFGGDPNRVTVFGESAGGGSIMHHLIAEGGKKKAPFDRAILQSPGFQTLVDVPAVWNRTLETASKLSGKSVSCGAELAALDPKLLQAVNDRIVFESAVSTFTFGPTVDGGYVPDLPGVLVLRGQFDLAPDLMLGHNSHEALLFLEPSLIGTEEDAQGVLANTLDGVSKHTVKYILSKVNPPPAQSGLYNSEYERMALLFSELSFVCNTEYAATAYHNETWNYRFQVAPGTHAQDVPYTFFNSGEDAIPELAKEMQSYFINFAQTGNPNKIGLLPEWPVYGDDAKILTFGERGPQTATDDAHNRRCRYWQPANYRD